MQQSEIAGKKFSVLGGAKSGLAVARLLKKHGAEVFLSDKAASEKMKDARTELEVNGISFEFGGNTKRILDADVLVLSPGVPTDIPTIRDARAEGVKVVSEIEVASWLCKAPIVAITGTNGKTTTTSLTGRMFADARRPSVVAGNIGVAFSEVVEELEKDSTAVLEVSSFQLDAIDTFRPSISVLLNITPDHLDRYEHSMDKYIASKCRVFENQRSGDSIIYNYDDDIVRTNVERDVHPDVKKLPFSAKMQMQEGASVAGSMMSTNIDGEVTSVVKIPDLSIKGQHNLMNAMAATLVAQARKIPVASIRATLKNFRGVEHRLEFVRELDGVSYVNDSKATNVDSVWYALQSFSQPIVLLLGGRDKGNNYSTLLPVVQHSVKMIIAIGESAPKVVSAFQGVKPVTVATTMADAITEARRKASSGDVVLLSPACASFDWFDNYEHRGKVFKEFVLKLQ